MIMGGPIDPPKKTRPDRATGRARAEIFTRIKKKTNQPENYN
jgi:hypothetical protein